MTGTFVLSYVILWFFVLLNLLLTVLLMRSISRSRTESIQKFDAEAIKDIFKPGEALPDTSMQLLDTSRVIPIYDPTKMLNLIVFVSPLCGSCEVTLSYIEKYYESIVQNNTGLLVVSLGGEKDTQQLKELAEFTLPILTYPSNVRQTRNQLKVPGYPFHYVVDQDGIVRQGGYFEADNLLQSWTIYKERLAGQSA